MCGIVGFVGRQDAAPILLEGLRRLEYRGYDSAGIATLVNGHIERRRASGKLKHLAGVLEREPMPGLAGIGHTRWATHGAPTVGNAHPHGTPRVAVVHNGIIENHAALRTELEALGQRFESETDTETVAQMLDYRLRQGDDPEQATSATLKRLHGAFGIAIVFAGRSDTLIAARRGSPLAIGYGDGEMYIGSDALALAPATRRIAYLEEGDWAIMSPDSVRFFDADDQPVERSVKLSALSGAAVGRGAYRHFMEKELHEHPVVIGETLRQYINAGTREVALPELGFDPVAVPKMTITACGSAFFAGQVGRYWIEELARIPVEADTASELRYRNPPLTPGGAAIMVSQSGETADTLGALRLLRNGGQRILSVVNVAESSIARSSHATLLTVAGPEIGVASTKAFTAQLSLLACLAIGLGRARGTLAPEQEAELTMALLEVPGHAAALLESGDAIRALVPDVAAARDVLFLGRGSLFPIAMEGALKLKEISYIHAEGYAAGEMKHGPIALIDDAVPVIALCPSGPLFEKTASNLQEAAARGGRIMAFTDAAGAPALRRFAEHVVVLPTVHPFAAPILYAIPVQMLAYYVAVARGTDVDQPRNLAKSVTVE